MKKTLQTIKKAGFYSAFFGVSLLSAQTTYTFTNASATGRFGPTAPQIAAAYLSTNLNGSVTIASGVQQFTVPNSGLYSIEVWGAGNVNCYGAKLKGTFNLVAGNILNIAVGHQAAASGGHGGTFVSIGPSLLTTTAMIVAGGGGGNANGSFKSVKNNATYSTSGNPGTTGYGGTAGLGAQTNTNNTTYGGGGGGGFAGNGVNTSSYGVVGSGFIFGALGGPLGGTANTIGAYGGGGSGYTSEEPAGGGGYSGGGGGGYEGLSSTGEGSNRFGGGGGSYNTGVTQTTLGITNAGYGTVILTALYSLSISQTSTIACNGLLTAALSSTVSGGVGPFTYSWSPFGGTASTATGLGAGSYTCTVSSAVSGTTSSVFTVTQPAILVSSIASQTNVTCNGCSNGAITLATTGGTAPYSYTWSPTGGSAATASGLAANTYSCIIKDANLCPASSSPSATITQPASFSITASASSSVICGSGSTTLTASGASTYTWTGGVVNGAAFSPTVSNTYSAMATNSLGCAASNTAVVTVNVGSIPTISVTSGVICSGKSYTMVASGAGTYSYTGGSAVVTPTATMSYSVTGTSSLGCVGSNTAVSTVTVNSSPSVIASTSNSMICSGESAILSASTSATSYTWNTGALTMSTSVSPTVTSTYTVNVSNAVACVASSTVMVTVNACVGINEAVASLISVYPNPNNGILNINLTAELAKNSSLEIYDALGKLVVKEVLVNELNTINISNLDNGIYTFKVLNNINTVKIGKLIKQ